MKDKEKQRKYNREYYYKNKETILKRQKLYRPKYIEQAKEYMKEYNNSEEHKKKKAGQSRRNHLSKNYGISVEEYNLLFEKQEGRCLICHKHQSELKRSLYVDHNHESGEVRGLLCASCNFLLGCAKDDINILLEAIKYLNG